MNQAGTATGSKHPRDLQPACLLEEQMLLWHIIKRLTPAGKNSEMVLLVTARGTRDAVRPTEAFPLSAGLDFVKN